MHPRISIIIPVYKVEKYLARCLDSVCAQSLSDIEIIVIDDGSPDKCGSICDEYAKKDTRVKVIHKDNEGVSAARNTGLHIAQGDFVGFVDSDDYISPFMFEELYNKAIQTNADISMCHFIRVSEESSVSFWEESCNYEYQELTRKQAVVTISDYSRPLQIPIWNKLFNRELIEGVYFDTKKRMAEDCEFSFRALVRCERVVYLPYPFYGYFDQREGAATHHGSQDMNWYFESARNITEIMDNAGSACPEIKDITAAMKCVNGYMSIANQMVRSGHYDKNTVKAVKKELKKNFRSVMRSELHFSKKAQMMVFLFNTKVYYLLMKKKLGG